METKRKYREIPRDDLEYLEPYYLEKTDDGKYEALFPTYVDKTKVGKLFLYGYDELATKRYCVRLWGNSIVAETKEETKALVKALRDKLDITSKLWYVSEIFFTDDKIYITGSNRKEIEIIHKGSDLTKFIEDAITTYHYSDEVDRLVFLYSIGFMPETLIKKALKILNKNKIMTEYIYSEILEELTIAYSYYEDGGEFSFEEYKKWREKNTLKVDGSDLSSEETKSRAIKRALILYEVDWLQDIYDAGHISLTEICGRMVKEAGGNYDFSYLLQKIII